VVTDSHSVLHFIKEFILSNYWKDCNFLCMVPCWFTISQSTLMFANNAVKSSNSQWDRNLNFMVSVNKNDVCFLNGNFYIPDQFFFTVIFPTFNVWKKWIFSLVHNGEWQERSQNSPWSSKRIYQWVILFTLCLADKL
jgi:hypothetical protein